MDIARPRRRDLRPWITGAAALALVAATVGFGRMKPALPAVDGATLWTDTVVRGPMVREVRAVGTLTPENLRWVSAVTAGRIERIHVRAGETVEAGTVLLDLVNPDVQLEALDAERQLNLAQSNLASLEASLESGVIAQEGAVAGAHTSLEEARRSVASAETLAARGLASANELARARDLMHEMTVRDGGERQRLEVARHAAETQLALQRAQVERLRAIARFYQGRIAALHVTAGGAGVLQDMDLEVGQWVNPGQLLAKVAEPGHLKAVLRVPETLAKDLAVGLPAVVDTRNGTVPGRVARIDPAVQNGTVTVDVVLEGGLPAGARPDLSVDGTVVIEKLDDVLHLGRPARAWDGGAVRLFKLVNGGREAVRTEVRVGRSSVNQVEIVGGLEAGDQVILSDMSRWDDADRLRVR